MSNNDLSTFPARLSYARKRRNIAQSELAYLVGVSPSSLTRWERGQGTPRANRMPTLAGILSVPLSWLLTGQGEVELNDRAKPEAGLAITALAELSKLRSTTVQSAEKLHALEIGIAAVLEEQGYSIDNKSNGKEANTGPLGRQ